ncbi:MAG: DUF1573 domain-containing protein [Flavobacteriales bacterium]|nr:DUF1573 domain-containing protein [Flavobacteriales bacterium]MCC6939291.1 DUF1573 domain-containing protein [Flavobacteriales bacterium]
MKDKIQIALLAVIAVALGAIAWGQLKSDSSNANTSNVVAAEPAAPAADGSFDPMANTTPVVDNTPKTTMTFGKYEHDFGTVKQDTKNKYVFVFTNTGKEPLIIESATGSCGCTVPSYPKAPIAPGATGQIEVEYSPGKQENAQQKTVKVVANTEPKETELRIKAFVTPGTGDAKAAGENQTIQIGQ